MSSDRVLIHYLRLPDREEIFDQRVVWSADDVIVTVTDPVRLPGPLSALGSTILEPGARAVWFTFPGAWHDVGRFHLADGTFTGCYGNILTPPVIEGTKWRTTDLFLDVWVPNGGPAHLLDEDELEAALAAGHIDTRLAARARTEAVRLVDLASRGAWPPAIVSQWTLARIEAAERGAQEGWTAC